MKTQGPKNKIYPEGYDIISFFDNLQDYGLSHALSEDWRIGAGKKLNSLADLIRKASRIDLRTGLFGRTLSEQDMEMARNGDKIERILASDSRVKIKYSKIRDGFAVRKIFFSFEYFPEKGFYPYRRVTSFYDSSGKLEKREVARLDGDYNVDENHHFVVKFNPPGRIIGQRERI